MDNYLKAIDKKWDDLIFYLPKDEKTKIGLPNPYVSPSAEVFGKDQFYWDSYFIILGLLASGKVGLAKGIVDNFVFLFNKFHIIPSRNRYYNLGISQPPFLTSMAFEVFNKTQDIEWLSVVMDIAEKELKYYWTNPSLTECHIFENGLSRYCDHHINHITAEHESGWDMTSRFSERCLDFAAVDLNSLLYKYEKDLSCFYKMIGNKNKSKVYLKKANIRKSLIASYCWDEEVGFFFDYDLKNNKRSAFYSLAGFFPLWAGICSKEEAVIAAQNLKMFEHAGGLSATQFLPNSEKQWDYPNGWAPLNWIAVKALSDYGLTCDATRIANKWVKLNKQVFDQTGNFYEKYNVVSLASSCNERYPCQTGFGWTNAVFILMDNFLKKENKESSSQVASLLSSA